MDSEVKPWPIRHRHNLIYTGVAILVVVADQLTKWWALEALSSKDIDVIWTLRFRLVHNSGAAFGQGQDWGSAIAVVALVFVVAVVWINWGGKRLPLSPWLVGMVLGGAIGNLADRAFRGDGGFMSGPVVDFVDLQWWPVFNVADASIVVAGILLVLAASRNQGAREEGATESDDQSRASSASVEVISEAGDQP